MPEIVAAFLALVAFAAQAATFDPVLPGKALAFPRDRGAHPGHRVEWWYVTGQLESSHGPLGFQITFFRLRNPAADASPGRFAPRQMLFAHAALADPRVGRLLHDQRAARALGGLVEASTEDTALRLDDWTLVRDAKSGRYDARIAGEDFALDLAFVPSEPPLPQGEGGFSRKGPSGAQASYYYSEPQLAVSGRVRDRGEALEVKGTAWLDHEWSSEYLAPDAAGWDWLGANLDDGGALMAFRIRARDGTVLWADAMLRARDGTVRRFRRDEIAFAARRSWKSPRTGAEYPVALAVTLAGRTWDLEPLMDDQELDARASTGTVYWEGAVRLEGAAAGRGYLELTGYAGRVPL